MKKLDKINMSLKKDTKNTFVYEATGTAIPNLYIQKTEFTTPPPKTIHVEISYEE